MTIIIAGRTKAVKKLLNVIGYVVEGGLDHVGVF